MDYSFKEFLERSRDEAARAVDNPQGKVAGIDRVRALPPIKLEVAMLMARLTYLWPDLDADTRGHIVRYVKDLANDG